MSGEITPAVAELLADLCPNLTHVAVLDQRYMCVYTYVEYRLYGITPHTPVACLCAAVDLWCESKV